MRTGTSGLETTDWPSAASVGARIAASSAASQIDSWANSTAATTAPETIVTGRPMASMRMGRSWSRRSTRRSIRAASENSTSISVTSASVWIAV